jgi:branched-chain amino acid transport system ATP-binding protein
MLDVANLTARYGAIEAVRGVSLHVEEGEIVAVIGPNGAGKTTILSAIMGLLQPAGGSIRFLDEDITRLPTEAIVRRGIGLVPGRRRLFTQLSVRENLRLGAAVRRDRDGIGRDLRAMLDLFPVLRHRLDGPAGHLSGGEAQQLALARTMMGSPRLLLLDEPSLGLAPVLVRTVFELVGQLRERGLTVLLVEQNAFQALEVADRAYVLRNGEVAMEERSDRLRSEQALLEMYLGVEV